MKNASDIDKIFTQSLHNSEQTNKFKKYCEF